MQRSRLNKHKLKDVDCGVGAENCMWPDCVCPRHSVVPPEDVQRKGRTVYRAPAGPRLKRRIRPKGWSPMSDWVLVRTKTRSENWAALNCKQQDMETFSPRIVEPATGRLTALFPGYLFVRPGDRWKKLRNTYGVIDIVMQGDGPQYVPKVVMKALLKSADREGIVTLPEHRKPEKGERVQIEFGAWKGFKGLYDGLNPEGRVKVLLEFMGQTVTLTYGRVSAITVVDT